MEEDKGERIVKIGKETQEEMGSKRRREEEKEENETGSVKRRCVGSFSVEAFDIFSQGEIWRVVVVFFLGGTFGKPEDLSEFEPGSDRESVEPQSFSFSPKRAHSWAVTQKEMRVEGSQVKSASLIKKKNEVSHATAKFELFL